MRVGVVGLGAMGLEMAKHIKAKGHEVWATDIDPAAMQAAGTAGLGISETLDDLAPRADVFVVVVATDDQSVTVTQGLLAAGMAQGSVIAVAATNHPDTMIALEATCKEKGIGFIDAPVCYGMQGAIHGTLGSLVGGELVHVERARPVLASYSRFVEHVGGIGAGQLAKTCNNMLHWAACVANFEVLLLAKRYGVDAQRMREILLKCPGKNTTLERWDTTKFTWQQKDMDLSLEMAQDAGLSLPLFGQIDQLIKRMGAADVKALLYGQEASYLGQTVTPLTRGNGGLC